MYSYFYWLLIIRHHQIVHFFLKRESPSFRCLFSTEMNMWGTSLNSITSDSQTMTERFDVVIADAGPAGAQCARNSTGCVGAVLIETWDNTVICH